MMEDILVSGKDMEKQDRCLESVLRRFEEAWITLNKKKYELIVREVMFLGHHIGENGISPDPVKIKAITYLH